MGQKTSVPAFARFGLLVATAFLAALASLPALADPPTRAARISFVSGSASFSPAGSDEWLQARINRPVWIGDRLWSGDGRVELQLGGASLRLAPQTVLQVLNFDDRIAQFEVTQGNVALHVRTIDGNDIIEIDTPSFAFVTREEGDYRIDVARDYTAVSTRRGYADIYGQDVAYRIDRRERFAFYSDDLRDYDAGPLPPSDAFDRWSRERAQREDRSTSSRYVSPELVGYVDLDSHGEWRSEPSLGNVWIPRVAADWAPYRYGHWSWIDPWGWTWVDDAPWGYAPSHYGRWTQLGRTWAWVPGPREVRPAYSPALVAWIGGDNFSLTVSSGRTLGVGWFPLAPGEVWRPSYDVSREYFTRVNVANTVVNNTTIVNVYNNRNEPRIADVRYRFHAAPAAVTAVPVDTFVQGRPVQQTQRQINVNVAAQASVLAVAPAQPVRQSFVGPAPRTQAKPPAEVVQRAVVARSAPPAPPPTIEQRTAMVREGKPLTRETLDRGATAPAAQKPAPQPPGQAAAPQQAQAPASAPPPPRANVRVVEADKTPPKPLPPGEARASRGDDRGRGPQGTPPGQSQQAGSPGRPAPAGAQAPQPAQAAQPAPPPRQPASAGQAPKPAPGAPAADAPRVAQPAPAPSAAPPAPPPQQSAQPRPAPGEAPQSPPTRSAAPQAGPPAAADSGRVPPGRATPPREPPASPAEAPNRREGAQREAQGNAQRAPASGTPPEAPNRREGQQAAPGRPSSPTAPAAAAPAAPAQAGRPPAAEPPAPEGRGRNDASDRRNGDAASRAGRPPDERRAQPAQTPPSAQPAPPPRPDSTARAPAPPGQPAARSAPAQPTQGQGQANRGDRPEERGKDARSEKDKDREEKDKNREEKDKN